MTFLVSKLTKSKFILWTDEWGWPKPFPRRMLSPLIGLILRHATAIVVHGRRHSRYFQSSLGIEADKVFVSGNASSVPVDTHLKTDTEQLASLHGLSGRFIILYAGGLVKRKGVDLLIRAFERLRSAYSDVHLMIVGEGPERIHLLELSSKLGLESSVSFVGWVHHANMAPYYALADLVVLPSTYVRDKGSLFEPIGEPWGLVVNEGMSMAKPIITTDAVGCAEDLVVNGLNGYVVQQGDTQALFAALDVVVRNRELIRQMGEASKRIIADFTYAKMARVFAEAIRQSCIVGGTRSTLCGAPVQMFETD